MLQKETLSATLFFTGLQMRATVRNWRGFLMFQLTPIFMLLIFWFVGRGSDSEFEVVRFLFPAIIGLGVMMGGGGQAMRTINWREQGVFRRLAVTPVPVGYLLLGDALANALLGVLQGIITLLFGVIVLQLPVSFTGALVSLLLMFLAGLAFTAYGLLIATFVKRPDVANGIFIFTLLPMFFLGGGLPGIEFGRVLQLVGDWSPVGIINRILIPLINAGEFVAGSGLALVVLVGYTVVFGIVIVARFRVE